MRERPRMVVFNGERFLGFGGHSNNEIGVCLALGELSEEAIADYAHKKGTMQEFEAEQKKMMFEEMILLQWAGVWDRIAAEDANLSVVFSKEQIVILDSGACAAIYFCNLYGFPWI